MEGRITDNAEGISIDDFMSEVIDSETPNAEIQETDTKAEKVDTDDSLIATDETETTETNEDVDDDDYLADVDEDEVDNPDEDSKDTDEAESSDDEVKDTQEFTFKADGEDITVSLDELKKSYGLQKNLTRKGQELAEKEKAVGADAEVVNYYKQTPERLKLSEEINAAQDAIDKGFYFDAEGNQVKLTRAQIEDTQKNVSEANKKFNELATPPLAKEAQDAVPELWSADKRVQSAATEKYGNYLASIGYTESMIKSISPAELLLAKRALDGDELATRVKASKARRADKAKPSVVNKVTKPAKGSVPKSNQRGKGTPSVSLSKQKKALDNGDMSMTDFMMLDD